MQTGNIVEIRGDGEFVSIEIETEYGERCLIQSAARIPEKDCTDLDNHWCGCK